MRVYELAKELGVDSGTVIRCLTDLGEFARSASAPLEPPVVRRVRQHFGGQPAPNLLIPRPPRQAPKRDLPGHNRPAPWVPEPAGDVYSEAERIFGRPVTRPRAPRRPPTRPASFTTPVPEPGKSIPNPTDQYDIDWARRMIPPEDRRDFIAAGLDHRSAAVVEQCLLYGLTAADLSRRIDGIRVAQRLRNREPIASIAAYLREHPSA